MKALVSALLLTAFLALPHLGAASSMLQDKLQGTWESESCEQYGGLNVRRTFEFKGSGSVMRYTAYADRGCTDPVVSTRVLARISPGGAPFPNAGFVPLDLQIQSREITPASDGAAQWMNSAQACGLTGWKAGKARKIAPGECLKNPPLPAEGCAKEYDVAKVDGSRLFVGNRRFDKGPCAPELRPMAVQDKALRKK